MKRHKTVLLGRDCEAIPPLLEIHCEVDDPKILDCTYNKGTMWKKTDYRPHRMDIDPRYGLDTVGDFTAMPFPENSFDVIVFDPPHLPTNACSNNSSKMWEDRYGITSEGDGREGDNIIGMFMPFLFEAKRVLVPGGIILAKLTDIVHNHRYQWQQVSFINCVMESGMTPCDMMIKCDPNAGNLKSSKWKSVKHLRKSHCYWIVVRNSKKCEKK